MLYYITSIKKELWNKEKREFDDNGGHILSNHPDFPYDFPYEKNDIGEEHDLYPITRLFIPNRTCEFINGHNLKMIAITQHEPRGEDRFYGVTIYFNDYGK